MKKIAVAVLALVLLCFMGGCAGTSAKDVDINKVADELKSQITYQDDLGKLTDEMFDGVYKIDRALIKQAVAYTSSGATAEEIVAIELNKADDVKTAVTALEDRVKYQKDGYADYGPKEVPKLDNAVIIESGNYVFMSVSDDHAKADNIIKSFIG